MSKEKEVKLLEELNSKFTILVIDFLNKEIDSAEFSKRTADLYFDNQVISLLSRGRPELSWLMHIFSDLSFAIETEDSFLNRNLNLLRMYRDDPDEFLNWWKENIDK